MDVQSPSNQLTDWQSTLRALEKLYSILHSTYLCSYLYTTSKKTHFKIVRAAHYMSKYTGSNKLGTTTTTATAKKGYFGN